jgi:hypothetical protein
MAIQAREREREALQIAGGKRMGTVLSEDPTVRDGIRRIEVHEVTGASSSEGHFEVAVY